MHGTTVSGVSPARSRARLLTILNVDPGADWPNVARFWPPVPGPLAAATISPVLGRSATSALAGPTPASSCSALVCRPTSRESSSGSPGVASVRNSSRTSPCVRYRDHADAGRPAQPLVVPRLEAGQAGQVAGVVLRVLGDDLRGHLADPAEQRRGEVAGRRQRQVAGDDPGARDRLDAVRDRGRQLLAAEHDRLDERLRPGRRAPPSRRARGRCRRARPAPAPSAAGSAPSSVGLSMPTRDTGRSVTIGWPPAPRMSPRSASTEDDVERLARRPGSARRPTAPRPPATRPRRTSARAGASYSQVAEVRSQVQCSVAVGRRPGALDARRRRPQRRRRRAP